MEATPQGQTSCLHSGSRQGWTRAVTLSPLGKHALPGSDPQIPSPSNSALPAWHAHTSSHPHIPIHFLIRIFISSEQENKLQEAEKTVKEELAPFQPSHPLRPSPSAAVFALKAKEADMLENTFCFRSGESRAGAVWGEAGAWGRGEFAVNNSQPLAPFRIVTQSGAAVTGKTDCLQNCS